MAEDFANGSANPEASYDQEYQEGLAESGENATSIDPGAGDRINASKREDDERKIFVGGLSWETQTKDIREYFSKFGEVLDCVVKTDPETNRSRGFGFVLFKEVESIDKVMDEKTHSLHGRNIDPKRAKARGGRDSVRKVFVGGLDPDLPVEEIRAYFSQKGKIEEIDLPFDKVKGQRRQFCFITFESEEVVDKVVEEPVQYIGKNKIDVKKATPKEVRGPPGADGPWGGRGGWGPPGGPPGRGGRGRGRGGGPPGWGGGYDQGYGQGYGGWGGYGWGGPNDYYNNWYNQQGYGGWGGYGGGYDYSGYGGYDWNGWYGQQGGEGGQSGDSSNYDWSAWYASQGQQPPPQAVGDQQQQQGGQPPPAGTGGPPPGNQQGGGFGKGPPPGKEGETSQQFHPYQRT